MGLATQVNLDATLLRQLLVTSARLSVGARNSWRWAKLWAAARAGYCSATPRDGKLLNQWAADHCHTLAGGQPILALDMYEHSYHIDYGAKAANYVDTYMNAIRWSNADRLFASYASKR